jgi:hypothetical protein
MALSFEMAYKSLIKHGEELCGDRVQIVQNNNSKILILADGMGSGVRANILSTMTSKILGTLFFNEIKIDEAVETIANTLPVSSVNGVAYSTFSILQMFDNGSAYLVEYDNPACIAIRKGALYELPYREREIAGKKIREAQFQVQEGDAFLLMSDGALYCGAEDIINYGWDWKRISEYAVKCSKKAKSANRLACLVSDACNDLYLQTPSDDTTIAVAKVRLALPVNIMTGPAKEKEMDHQMVTDFNSMGGYKIVCGGTTSNVVARELNRPITTDTSTAEGKIPPMSKIDGIDLVTEGVITLNHVLELLMRYADDDIDADFFIELDGKNGASRIASTLIDNCTRVNFFIGSAVNDKDVKSVSFDLSVRHNLTVKLAEVLQKMGKDTTIHYY